jgi:hypothetical protein
VHGDVVAGPFMWALFAVLALPGLLALFVTVDGLRRPASDLKRVRETRWPYVAICGLYVAVYVALQFPAVTERFPDLGVRLLCGVPIVLALGAAYLLRVVFPKRAASDADEGPAQGPAEAAPDETDPSRSTPR